MNDDTENSPKEPAVATPENTDPQPQTEVSSEVSEPEPEIAADAALEPASESLETETAQMGGIEPLDAETRAETNEGAGATAEAPKEEPQTHTPPDREPERHDKELKNTQDKTEQPIKERLGLLRKMAHATILLRREKKLQKIMEHFAKHSMISNDQVQGLLRVSDATATRYLALLEERGKITQRGNTGRGVVYTKR